jgi:hypothetical protein
MFVISSLFDVLLTYKIAQPGFSTIEPVVMGKTAPLEDEFAPYMHLPCMDIVNFDEEDQRLLSNVRHEDDVYRVMQRYVLDTASNCIRIMYECEHTSAFTDKVRFSIANRLLPAHHGRWDIFILVHSLSFLNLSKTRAY